MIPLCDSNARVWVYTCAHAHNVEFSRKGSGRARSRSRGSGALRATVVGYR